MNILDLKRQLWAMPGVRWNDRGTDGGGTGSGNTGGTNSGGNGDDGGSNAATDGPTNSPQESFRSQEISGPLSSYGFTSGDGDWGDISDITTPAPPAAPKTTTPPSPDLETAFQQLQKEADERDEKAPQAMFSKDISYADLAAMSKIGMGDEDVPGRPNQTIDQALGVPAVHGFLNSAVPAAVSAINPGFGLVMSGIKAYDKGDLKGFIGGLGGNYIGGLTGIPGASAALGSLGKSLARGEAPNFGSAVASLAGGAAGSVVSRAVSESAGPLVGMVAGQVASNTTRSATNNALGAR